MKSALKFSAIALFSAAMFAQGPPPGRGHGGFGPGPGGFGIMSAGPASRTPVTGAPYSAVEIQQDVQTLANGNQITRQVQTKVYRDKDGRVRTERTFTPHGSTTAQTSVAIFDPVGGNFYSLNPSNNTAMKRPLPTQNFSHAGGPRGGPRAERGTPDNSKQVATESLGTQPINGIAATGTRYTETIPAGAIGNAQPIQVVREVWVSNDLKVPVLIKSSDPRFGTSIMQLTNIVQSDPDSSLFVVPSTYTMDSRADSGSGRGFGGPRPTRQRPPQN
jgi:hypothetical protein